MEKLSEFFGEHWVLLIIVNFLAIAFVIGYLYEKHNEDKKTKKNKYKDMIIFDNQINTIKNNTINKLEKDNVIENNEINNINPNIKKIDSNIKNLEEKKVQNLYTIDKETKKQIHDNIEYIINQNNSVFDEFDNVVPKKKIIEDKIKKELEILDEEETPILKNDKKNIDIDTNIELPEINISVDDEDIWS